MSGWRALMCGGCAGFSCWFFSYGVDIAKTRIQANRPKFFKHHFFDGGLYEALKEIYIKNVDSVSSRVSMAISEASVQSSEELLAPTPLVFGHGRLLKNTSILISTL